MDPISPGVSSIPVCELTPLDGLAKKSLPGPGKSGFPRPCESTISRTADPPRLLKFGLGIQIRFIGIHPAGGRRLSGFRIARHRRASRGRGCHRIRGSGRVPGAGRAAADSAARTIAGGPAIRSGGGSLRCPALVDRCDRSQADRDPRSGPSGPPRGGSSIDAMNAPTDAADPAWATWAMVDARCRVMGRSYRRRTGS